MLWLKAFHIVFVVTWFAGLFYLPRLFVYHASATDEVGLERFKTMERRLFVMMTIGFALAMLFGIAILIHAPSLLRQAGCRRNSRSSSAIGYHLWCFRLSAHSERPRTGIPSLVRLFNEAPSLLLIAIVILVVLKPF